MTMRVNLLALLVLAFCIQGVEAKDQFFVRGDGYHSCGAWTAAQAHRPYIGPGKRPVTIAQLERETQIAWVNGFITAFDYYASESGGVGNSSDLNGILVWIDNYCATQPLDNITTATIALVSELSKRTSQ